MKTLDNYGVLWYNVLTKKIWRCKMKCEIYNDHFENAKRYGIPHAQLIVADIPYNLGNNAYASNPAWYKDGDNANGESELAGKQFFDTDDDFRIGNFFDFCTRYLKKEPKVAGGGQCARDDCLLRL